MPKRKTKTTKKGKSTMKKKTTKKVKYPEIKKGKKYPVDQFEDINGWLDFYKENKKFPYRQVLCCKCHVGFASLKGLGMKTAFQKCENDPKRVLTETCCKDCREFSPKERKVKILTPEEAEARAEEIRKSLPKIDFHKERVVIDLVKDKSACEWYTQFSCVRPDIYLDNDRTCDFCKLNKYCICPIKKFSKEYKKQK